MSNLNLLLPSAVPTFCNEGDAKQYRISVILLDHAGESPRRVEKIFEMMLGKDEARLYPTAIWAKAYLYLRVSPGGTTSRSLTVGVRVANNSGSYGNRDIETIRSSNLDPKSGLKRYMLDTLEFDGFDPVVRMNNYQRMEIYNAACWVYDVFDV
jgi:hypothetical protein